MKPSVFKIDRLQEFQEMIDKKDIRLHKALIASIFKNLKTRKKNIHMFSIDCQEDNVVFDIMLEKNQFITTLKENLVYFESQEMYEECTKISEAINSLNKTNG